VKEDKIDKNQIETIRQNLADEAIDQIDFDKLNELLMNCSEMLDKYNQQQHELRLLSDDYRSRIVGMVKANLACRMNERDRILAARLADDADRMTSEELITIYGKVVARFRSNFPASFRYLTTPSANRLAWKNWKEHKI